MRCTALRQNLSKPNNFQFPWTISILISDKCIFKLVCVCVLECVQCVFHILLNMVSAYRKQMFTCIINFNLASYYHHRRCRRHRYRHPPKHSKHVLCYFLFRTDHVTISWGRKKFTIKMTLR